MVRVQYNFLAAQDAKNQPNMTSISPISLAVKNYVSSFT